MGAASMLLVAMAAAAAVPPTQDLDSMVESLKARVQEAHAAGYRSALQEFDAQASLHPQDVELRIAKCRFIGDFAWSEDEPIESAHDDLEQCAQALREGEHAREPRVQLFLVRQKYGDEARKAGEEISVRSGHWPAEDRGALYEFLAEQFRYSDYKGKYARYAELAVKENPSSRLRIEVATRRFENGAFAAARELVESTPVEAWKSLPVEAGAAILVRTNSAAHAAALLREHPLEREAAASQMRRAAAFAEAGAVEEARDLFERARTGNPPKTLVRELRQQAGFQLKHGDREQAIAAYRSLRDAGARADPIAYHRLALTLRYPTAPWQWADSLGVLLLLLALAAIAALPCLVVAGVHYRSLALRVRGITPREGPWRLSHVWYALAVILFAQALGGYLFAHDAIASFLSGSVPVDGLIDPAAIARALMAQVVIALVLMLPLLRKVDLRILLLGNTRPWVSAGLALLAFLAIRILVSIIVVATRLVNGSAEIGNVTTFAIQSIQFHWNGWVALGLVAGLVPVVEELVFRGVMLQGLSRYIGFWWAALIQAVVFTSLHETLLALPFVFVIGVTAAWLVRRTRSLLAPMLLHALNNATAFATIAVATDVLNR